MNIIQLNLKSDRPIWANIAQIVTIEHDVNGTGSRIVMTHKGDAVLVKESVQDVIAQLTNDSQGYVARL